MPLNFSAGCFGDIFGSDGNDVIKLEAECVRYMQTGFFTLFLKLHTGAFEYTSEANHIAASRIAASRDSCGTIRATIVEIASLLQPCLSKSKSPSPK